MIRWEDWFTRGAENLLCTALLVAGNTVYGGYFGGTTYLWPLLVAAVAGGLVGVLAAQRHSSVLVLSVAVIGYLVLAAETLYRPTTAFGFPTGQTAKLIAGDLVQAWGRMLSVGLPADAGRQLLVLPLAITWLAALAAVTAARWSKAALAPIVAPLAAFVTALLIAAGSSPSHPRATAGFIAAAAGLAIIRAGQETPVQPVTDPAIELIAHPDSTAAGAAPKARNPIQVARARLSRAILGALVIGAVVLGAAVGADAVPTASHRFDPRQISPPPVTAEATVTPLATIKSQLLEKPARALFTVRIAGGHVDRVRLAVLDHYDGATWTTQHHYLVGGRTLVSASSPHPAVPITMSVRIAGLDEPFLPVIGTPIGLHVLSSGSGTIGFDPATGTLATDTSDLEGLSYQVNADELPAPADLSRATPIQPSGDLTDVQLPEGMPAPLSALQTSLETKAQTPLEQLQLTQAYLRSLPYSLKAPPGHTYGALARMIAATKAPDDLGYAEQHAAAFAVLARAQGFATRVVVGYVLRRPRQGYYTVTTADADAWPEVNFGGVGWVPFNPTDVTHLPSDQTQLNQPPVPGRDLPPPPVIAPPAPGPRAGAKGQEGSGFGLIRATLLAWAAVAVILLVLISLTLATKRVRRRRRRTGPTNARVEGAWAEALDRLTEHGLRPAAWATHAEIAEQHATTRPQVGSVLAALAPRAASARFAARDSPPAEAQTAWRLERQLTSVLTTGRFRLLRRARAQLDPRPLWTSPAVRASRRRPSAAPAVPAPAMRRRTRRQRFSRRSR